MVKEIYIEDWTTFKTLLANKNALLQESGENPTHYNLFFIQNSTEYQTDVEKGTGDATDYEDNFRPTVNDKSPIPTFIVGADGTTAQVNALGQVKVEAQVSQNVQARVSEPVQLFAADNKDRTKCSYTIPTGKMLYVQSFLTAVSEGKMSVCFRWNGSAVFSVGLNEDGTTSFHASAPSNNPFGPVPAGHTIDLYRVSGDNKKWSAAVFGYLENE